jgi:hypothetical protein
MAYAAFIGKLGAMAKEAKHVTVKDRQEENEKYAFRCFLLRLGFIGPEYKENRKGVDDIGSIMVNWDNGSGLSVAYGEDIVRKVQS